MPTCPAPYAEEVALALTPAMVPPVAMMRILGFALRAKVKIKVNTISIEILIVLIIYLIYGFMIGYFKKGT